MLTKNEITKLIKDILFTFRALVDGFLASAFFYNFDLRLVVLVTVWIFLFYGMSHSKNQLFRHVSFFSAALIEIAFISRVIFRSLA
jgi:hypothetical protein